MRFSHYLSISCGSRHLAAARLSMTPSGRCELEDYWLKEIDFATTEPLIWLKALSQEFAAIRRRFGGDAPVGYALPGNLVLSKFLKIPQAPEKKWPPTWGVVILVLIGLFCLMCGSVR